jgi:hypothetical protein
MNERDYNDKYHGESGRESREGLVGDAASKAHPSQTEGWGTRSR